MAQTTTTPAPTEVLKTPAWEPLRNTSHESGDPFSTIILPQDTTGPDSGITDHKPPTVTAGLVDTITSMGSTIKHAARTAGRFVAENTLGIGDTVRGVIIPRDGSDENVASLIRPEVSCTLDSVATYLSDAFPEDDQARFPEIKPFSDMLVDASARAGRLGQDAGATLSVYSKKIAPYLLPAFALHGSGSESADFESFYDRIRDNPEAFKTVPAELLDLYFRVGNLHLDLVESSTQYTADVREIMELGYRITSTTEAIERHAAERAKLEEIELDLHSSIRLSELLSSNSELVGEIDASDTASGRASQKAHGDEPLDTMTEEDKLSARHSIKNILKTIDGHKLQIITLKTQVSLDTVNLQVLRATLANFGQETRNRIVPQLEALEEEYAVIIHTLRTRIAELREGLGDAELLLTIVDRGSTDSVGALSLIGDGNNLDPSDLIGLALKPDVPSKANS